jgi:hypothetical protein
MNTKAGKRKKWYKRLMKHYRLVVMNDENFEIRSSVKLTPLNVLFIFSTLFVIFTALLLLLMRYTSVKDAFFGADYSDRMRREIVEMRMVTDSLDRVVGQQNQYLEGLMRVLSGDIDTTLPPYKPSELQYDTASLLQHSAMDSMLRADYERKRSIGILEGRPEIKLSSIEEKYFIPPVQGIVVRTFNPETGHYGLDIVAKENSAIKSVLEGKVIFTGWTADYGHVIVIQHEDNLVSLYKHNSALLKKVGNFVRAGEAIALIGNTGELSQGPHVHFELWHDLVPVDPLKYIVFN